jgi:hypothetical protein
MDRILYFVSGGVTAPGAVRVWVNAPDQIDSALASELAQPGIGTGPGERNACSDLGRWNAALEQITVAGVPRLAQGSHHLIVGDRGITTPILLLPLDLAPLHRVFCSVRPSSRVVVHDVSCVLS